MLDAPKIDTVLVRWYMGEERGEHRAQLQADGRSVTTPALLEALERARKRVDVLELEKSHALHRFEEQTAELRRVKAELKSALERLAKLAKYETKPEGK